MIKTVLVILAFTTTGVVGAATPPELLKTYEAQSGKASSVRGEQFFNSKHGKEWSCASCHENPPNHDTKHIVTGKVIKPLAPVAIQPDLRMMPKLKNGSSAIAMMCLEENVLPKKKPMCYLGS